MSSAAATHLFRLHGRCESQPISVDLLPGVCKVGRDRDNDVVLDTEGVSRHHAILMVGRDGVEVIDRQSKNGTWVGDQAIDRARCAAGTVLRFGPVEVEFTRLAPSDVQLAFELASEAVELPVPATAGSTASATLDAFSHWLRLLGRLAETLARRPDASGLEVLLGEDGLRAAGAVIVRLQGGHTEVVTAAGEWTEEVLAVVSAGPDAGPGPGAVRPRFVTRPDCTVRWIPETGGGWRALVVAGDFPGRSLAEPLFEAVLRLYSSLHAADAELLSSVEDRSGLPADFPAGAVPANYVIGPSPVMRAFHEQLAVAAASELPVLIVGETGVGKEWVCRLLHGASPRAGRLLVPINCAAIPEELLEAELFGIGDRVATGVSGRQGKFQQAHGGTLFLDEIGEMPAPLQAKLLRVLQEGRVQPLGRPSLDVDVRVVSATNADPMALVRDGRFRQDLYYRLSGFVLAVPALRERRQDIPTLVEHVLRRTARQLGKPLRGLSVAALERLVAYDWPGNVRELEHVVQRLVHLCTAGQVIDSCLLRRAGFGGAEDALPATAGADEEAAAAVPLPVPASEVMPAGRSLTGRSLTGRSLTGRSLTGRSLTGRRDLDLQRLEQEAIEEALRRAQGRRGEAARLLGLSRFSLRRRLERLAQPTQR